MIYGISFVVYAGVFGAGLYIVKRLPTQAEKLITKLTFVGFMLQVAINYIFWGNPSAFFAGDPLASSERLAVNFMFLCLISIFCYASLLVILFKARDYYHE
ncbi:MAG: hypothetical protein Q4G13_08280 [Moraxella sp.]|nr:hypothetical protein [Moraxella sp.]